MRKNYTKGTTIIEIILYLGLISIFMVTLTNAFVAGANFKLESESNSTMQTDSQFIFSKLMNDLGNTDSISQPATLGVTTNTLVFTSSGATYTYALIDGDLIRSTNSESLKLNSLDTKLTSISFTRLGNGSGVPTIQVKYDVESTIVLSGERTEARSFQTTLGLR
jgi:hypothetical protein